MPGKKNSLTFQLSLIFFLICLKCCVVAAKEALVSGGMLYSKLSDQPVTVNPSTVIFYRHLNTSQLIRGVQLSGTYLHMYQTLCDKLNRRAYVSPESNSNPAKDYVIVGDGKIEGLLAENYCMSLGYQLPELRTKEQKLYVQNLMISEKIKWTRAGIKLDTNKKFVFMSDLGDLSSWGNREVFPYVTTGYTKQANFHNDYYALEDAKKFVFVYRLDKEIEIAMVNPGAENGIHHKIICQRTSKVTSAKRIESNILTKIAAHSCLRDMRSLYGTHQLVAKEVALFRKPTIGAQLDESTIFPEYFNTDTKGVSDYPALTIHDVCEPKYLADCKIHFMDFIDDMEKLSNSLSKESKLDVLLIRIYMVQYILRGDSAITSETDFNGCESKNLWRNSHKGFAAYMTNTMRLLQNLCPEFVPARLVRLTKEFMQTPRTQSLVDDLRNDYFNKYQASQKRTKRFANALGNMLNYMTIGPQISNFDGHSSIHGNRTAVYEFSEQIVNVTNFINKPNSGASVHIRKKRFSPLGIVGTIAALNGATSLGTGSAPLSWFGNVVGATMGLVTRQDLQVPLGELKRQSHALHNLTLNQHELENAYNSLSQDLHRVDSANHAIELSTATLISEYDNKMVLRNLHDTIQITIIKISQAMTNALNGHTSPYVLAPIELKELSTKYKESNIQLSDNIKDVMTTVLVDENEILFLFEVPVYNDRTLFQLYSVRPMPLYDDGKILTPVPDVSYFGISVTNSEYTILSQDEQSLCRKDQFCHVADVLRKIEETDHCVIKSFFKNVLACEMEQSQDNTGFFELHGRKLVYSVPKVTNIKLICKNATTLQHAHSTVSVSGVGLADIAPDCQVILPNDRRIFSNPAPLQETLGQANFMQIFNYLPELDNFTIEIRDQSIFNHSVLAQLHLRPVRD